MIKPFCCELGTTDPRSTRSIYIAGFDDYGETVIALYNGKPFDIRTLVGNFGEAWRIKRIKRGWLVSTFIITFIEENAEVEYRTLNAVGDTLAKATNS